MASPSQGEGGDSPVSSADLVLRAQDSPIGATLRWAPFPAKELAHLPSLICVREMAVIFASHHPYDCRILAMTAGCLLSCLRGQETSSLLEHPRTQ